MQAADSDPNHRRPLGFDYAWVVLAVGTLVVFGSLGLARFGYTMVLPAMQAGLGLDNTQAGGLATANLAGYLALSLAGGVLAARYGPRAVIAVGLAVAAAGMLLTGLAGGLAAATVWRALTGVGSGASNVPVMGLLAAWFIPRRRGLAAGIAVSGSSLALIALGPLVPHVLAAYGRNGWRACWFIFAGATAALAVLALAALRNRPSAAASRGPAAAADGEPRTTGAGGLRWASVYRSPVLWHVGLIYVAFGFSYIIYMTFFTKHLIAEGKSQESAGSLFMLMGWVSLPCGLIWGWVSDVIGRKGALVIVYLIHAVAFGLFALWPSGSPNAVYRVWGPPGGFTVSAILFGLTAWSIPAIMAAACGDLLGPRLSPAGLGFVTLFFGIGQAAGPSAAGAVADAAGSLAPAMLLAAGAALLGAVGALLLRHPALAHTAGQGPRSPGLLEKGPPEKKAGPDPRSPMRMMRLVLLSLVCLGAGCEWRGLFQPKRPPTTEPAVPVDPLPVQQARAYPETATGLFASLADFEDVPGGPRGHAQVAYFRIEPAGGPQTQYTASGGPDGLLKFGVAVTRTGLGAMEVHLPAGSELIFTSPHVRDFRGYRLLSLAVHSPALRDDLQVAMVSGGSGPPVWRSHRTLLRPGWNTVLIDIHRLADRGPQTRFTAFGGPLPGFDIRRVDEIRLGFADAGGGPPNAMHGVWGPPVVFHLDDVLLIDNRRAIQPVPAGMVLEKDGLNYVLTMPGRAGRTELSQCPDGLWRFGRRQVQVRLAAPSRGLPADGLRQAQAALTSASSDFGELSRAVEPSLPKGGEDLDLMGDRRVGQVELIEHNAVRLRLVNTWYFPRRSGEWASLAVPNIRWEHTFCADGREVVQVTLNSAGGAEIGPAGLAAPAPAAWAGGKVDAQAATADLGGGVGRWQLLLPPEGPTGELIADNYLSPGRLDKAIAADPALPPADTRRDGFDESQGCYFLAALNGQCRFTLIPPPEGLQNPHIVVQGPWAGPVHIASEGMAIRPAAVTPDGSAVFALPGLIRRPVAVEVTGKIRSPENQQR